MATTLQQDHGDPNTKNTFELEPNPFEQSFASKESSKTSSINHQNSITSPSILSPGGRKLPPLVLSPNVPSGWSTTGFGLTPNESSLRTGLTPGGNNNFPHSLNGLSLAGINTPGGSLGFTGFTPGLTSLLSTATKEFESQSNSNANANLNASTNLTQPNQQQAPQPAPQQQQQQPQIQVQQHHAEPKIDSSQPLPPSQTTQASTVHPPSTKPTKKTQDDLSTEKPLINKAESSKRGRKKGSAKLKDEPKAKKSKKNNINVTNSPNDIDTTSPIINNKPDTIPIELQIPKVENGSTKTSSSSPIDDSKLTEDERRKSFLERNRVAASKCRQRKKQQQVKMEHDLNFYMEEYNNLTTSIDRLKDQSILLRQYLSNANNNNSKLNNNNSSAEIINHVDGLLSIINQTNYMSRLRGNAPSNIIPTVQPINPNLVQHNPQLVQIPNGLIPNGTIPTDGSTVATTNGSVVLRVPTQGQQPQQGPGTIIQTVIPQPQQQQL